MLSNVRGNGMNQGDTNSSKTRWRTIAGFVFLCLIAFAIWSLWWEPARLVVVHRTIAIHPWHPEHAGLRVAMMSDLHVGSPHKGLDSLKQLVATTNAERPDMILLLGNFLIQGIIGGHFTPPEP